MSPMRCLLPLAALLMMGCAASTEDGDESSTETVVIESKTDVGEPTVDTKGCVMRQIGGTWYWTCF